MARIQARVALRQRVAGQRVARVALRSRAMVAAQRIRVALRSRVALRQRARARAKGKGKGKGKSGKGKSKGQGNFPRKNAKEDKDEQGGAMLIRCQNTRWPTNEAVLWQARHCENSERTYCQSIMQNNHPLDIDVDEACGILGNTFRRPPHKWRHCVCGQS